MSLTDYIVKRNRSYISASAVVTAISVVSENKHCVLRNLKGELCSVGQQPVYFL